MITLKESLLTKTKNKVADTKKTATAMSKIPKLKDWTKNGGSYYLDWDIQHIVDEYGEQYPFLQQYSQIKFYFVKVQPLVHLYLIANSDTGAVKYETTRCYGYEDWNTNITQVKKDTIDFITRVSTNKKEMDEFIEAVYSMEEKDIFGVL